MIPFSAAEFVIVIQISLLPEDILEKCLRSFLFFSGGFWHTFSMVRETLEPHTDFAACSDSGLGMVASIFLLLEHCSSVPVWVATSKTNLAGHSFVSSDSATLEAELQNTFQLAGLLI